MPCHFSWYFVELCTVVSEAELTVNSHAFQEIAQHAITYTFHCCFPFQRMFCQ